MTTDRKYARVDLPDVEPLTLPDDYANLPVLRTRQGRAVHRLDAARILKLCVGARTSENETDRWFVRQIGHQFATESVERFVRALVQTWGTRGPDGGAWVLTAAALLPNRCFPEIVEPWLDDWRRYLGFSWTSETLRALGRHGSVDAGLLLVRFAADERFGHTALQALADLVDTAQLEVLAAAADRDVEPFTTGAALFAETLAGQLEVALRDFERLVAVREGFARLAASMLWLVDGEPARFDESHQFVDVHDAVVPIGPNTRVRLASRAMIGDATRAWAIQLAEYEVVQPFAQLG